MIYMGACCSKTEASIAEDLKPIIADLLQQMKKEIIADIEATLAKQVLAKENAVIPEPVKPTN